MLRLGKKKEIYSLLSFLTNASLTLPTNRAVDQYDRAGNNTAPLKSHRPGFRETRSRLEGCKQPSPLSALPGKCRNAMSSLP